MSQTCVAIYTYKIHGWRIAMMFNVSFIFIIFLLVFNLAKKFQFNLFFLKVLVFI